MDVIIPNWPAPAHIGAFTTLRKGGVSRAPYDDGHGGGGLNLGSYVGDRPEDLLANRALLGALLPAEPAWLQQVHGSTVLEAASVPNLTAAPRADASVTAKARVVCA